MRNYERNLITRKCKLPEVKCSTEKREKKTNTTGWEFGSSKNNKLGHFYN